MKGVFPRFGLTASESMRTPLTLYVLFCFLVNLFVFSCLVSPISFRLCIFMCSLVEFLKDLSQSLCTYQLLFYVRMKFLLLPYSVMYLAAMHTLPIQDFHFLPPSHYFPLYPGSCRYHDESTKRHQVQMGLVLMVSQTQFLG
jgi:hypothetical protein